MSLKHKTKIYCSLEPELLEFIEAQSAQLKTTRSKYINSVLLKEYIKYKEKKIEQIIERIEF